MTTRIRTHSVFIFEHWRVLRVASFSHRALNLLLGHCTRRNAALHRCLHLKSGNSKPVERQQVLLRLCNCDTLIKREFSCLRKICFMKVRPNSGGNSPQKIHGANAFMLFPIISNSISNPLQHGWLLSGIKVPLFR